MTEKKSIEELLEIAKTSSCQDVLDTLKEYPDSNVRRAVARNQHTSSQTLNFLAFDAVENVSFMAVQNPNCPTSREFKGTNPCVSCQKDEREMVCSECETLEEYNKVGILKDIESNKNY